MTFELEWPDGAIKLWLVVEWIEGAGMCIHHQLLSEKSAYFWAEDLRNKTGGIFTVHNTLDLSFEALKAWGAANDEQLSAQGRAVPNPLANG